MDEQEFRRQLAFIPKFEGEISQEDIRKYDNVIVGGMGGSALAARLLFFLDPTFPIWLHDDYGLPTKHEGKTLYIAISYSGNTAETLSFAQESLQRKHSLVTVTSGGKLLDWAIQHKVPYVVIPAGFEPRNAVFLMLKTLLCIIDREALLPTFKKDSIDIKKTFKYGQEIGKKFQDKIPLIYASRSNYELAHIWKIMCDETGKIPAFANYFPELMHNEVQGIIPATAGSVAKNLQILLLLDREDDFKISHEMKIFQELASSQGVNIIPMDLPPGKASKLLFVEITASVAASTIANMHSMDANSTSFIEQFKKAL